MTQNELCPIYKTQNNWKKHKLQLKGKKIKLMDYTNGSICLIFPLNFAYSLETFIEPDLPFQSCHDLFITQALY